MIKVFFFTSVITTIKHSSTGNDLSFFCSFFSQATESNAYKYVNTDEAGHGDDVTEIKAHTETLMQCAMEWHLMRQLSYSQRGCGSLQNILTCSRHSTSICWKRNSKSHAMLSSEESRDPLLHHRLRPTSVIFRPFRSQ